VFAGTRVPVQTLLDYLRAENQSGISWKGSLLSQGIKSSLSWKKLRADRQTEQLKGEAPLLGSGSMDW